MITKTEVISAEKAAAAQAQRLADRHSEAKLVELVRRNHERAQHHGERTRRHSWLALASAVRSGQYLNALALKVPARAGRMAAVEAAGFTRSTAQRYSELANHWPLLQREKEGIAEMSLRGALKHIARYKAATRPKLTPTPTPTPKPDPNPATATTEDAIAAVRATATDIGLSDFGVDERRHREQAFTRAMETLDARGLRKIRAVIADYIQVEWQVAVARHADAVFRESVGKRLTELEEREREVAEAESALRGEIAQIENDREFFPAKDFQLVLGCLHSDKPDRTKERLDKAFDILNSRFEVREVRGKKIVRIRRPDRRPDGGRRYKYTQG